MPPLCLHCEKAPRQNSLRLCTACAKARSIRVLYKKSHAWTPEREARIQAFVEKAKRQEPLFPERESPNDSSSVSSVPA